MSHDDLAWLVQHHFKTLTWREYDWVFEFDQDVSLVATCLWRLVEAGRIRLTNQDDGHQFGLPAPVDAVNEVNHRLARASVEAVELRQGTLDLDLHFSTGVVLQFIPNSSNSALRYAQKPSDLCRLQSARSDYLLHVQHQVRPDLEVAS